MQFYKLFHQCPPPVSFLSFLSEAGSLASCHRVQRSLFWSDSRGPPKIMGGLGKIPYAPQAVEEVQTLISNLSSSKKDGSKSSKKHYSCKKSAFQVAGAPNNIVVTSWRFQDWDYKRDDLPTYARGLFTTKNEKGQHEIAIRGYD